MSCIRLPPLQTVRDIVKLYRINAIKELSQNFLLNERLTDKIVKCMGTIHNSQILEVGPGPGAITRSIIRKQPKRLIVVEKDERFKPALEMLQDGCVTTNTCMEIIFDDIMNVDTKNLFIQDQKQWDDECPKIHIVGNLPFNISTHLIIKWLGDIAKKKDIWSCGRVQMTLTFQKEVAERLVAQVSEDQRCRLSIMAQTWTTPKLRFIIPGSSFVPKPDVDVGVVSFTPLKKARTNHDFAFFEKINRHLFSFRQKYCIKSIGTLFPLDYRKHLSCVLFKLADVNPQSRSFELSIEEINRLASSYKYLCEKHPEINNYIYRSSRKVLSKKLIKFISVQDYEENKNCIAA